MQIVWLTSFLPSGCTSGSDIASQALIDACRGLGHKVDVHGYPSPTGAVPGFGEHPFAVHAGEMSSATLGRRARWFAQSLCTGRPLTSVKFITCAAVQALPKIVASSDLVIVDHIQLDWMFPHDRPWLAVAHNVESEVFAERAQATSNLLTRHILHREARLLRKIEARAAAQAVGIITFSDTDRAVFADRGATTWTVPLPGCLVEAPRPAISRHADLGLLGLWTWGPNRSGLDWFINRVVPLLPAEMTIAIGGKGSTDLPRHPQITFSGYVENPQSFLDGCAVTVIPSIVGGGIQIKTLNALASGSPVVATSFALRSIEPIPGTVRIADTPQAFAAACVDQFRHGRPDQLTGQKWNEGRHLALSKKLEVILSDKMGRGRA